MNTVKPRQSTRLRILVGLVTLSAIGIGVRQMWTTDFGMDERLSGDRRIVVEVDPAGAADRAGIQVGDEILADPGLVTFKKPWTEREVNGWNYRLGRAIAARHAPMRILHRGVVRNVDVVADPPPRAMAALRQLQRMAPLLPTTLAFLGMALLLAGPARSSTRARHTLALSFAALGPCWLIEWPAPGWPEWLFVVGAFIDCFGSLTGLLLLTRFCWTFPNRARLADSKRLAVAVAVPGVFAAAASFLDALHVVRLPHAIRGHNLLVAFDSLLAFASIAGLVWQRRRADGVIARRQATLLIASIAAGTLPPSSC